MATTRKPAPSVVVMTEDDLRSFMTAVQAGFADLNARLDAIESKMTATKPYPETVKLRKEIAAAALKAATTRPAPAKRTTRRKG